MVPQRGVLGADAYREPGQQRGLGGQFMGHHPVRGPPHGRLPVATAVPGRSRVLPVAADQLRRTHRIDEEAVDPVQRVVPRRPGDRPVRGQRLGPREDLLHHRPPPAGRLREPLQVGRGIDEPVGVVDAQTVDDPVPDQFEDLAVGGGEDLGILHPHSDEVGDGEEPAVVQLRTGQPPPAEPVVLGIQQFGHRQLGGAGPERELLLAVAQHLPVDLEPVELDADRPGEHRQQHLATARRPVDVEPAGVRGRGALAQHLPQRVVEAGHRGHVVRHEVHDQPEPVLTRRTGQLPQPLLPAEFGAHPAVVDDVVPVSGTGYGFEDRRQMQMGDAERGEIRHGLSGGREREVRLELEPVGGGGRHAPLRTQTAAFCVTERGKGLDRRCRRPPAGTYAGRCSTARLRPASVTRSPAATFGPEPGRTPAGRAVSTTTSHCRP